MSLLATLLTVTTDLYGPVLLDHAMGPQSEYSTGLGSLLFHLTSPSIRQWMWLVEIGHGRRVDMNFCWSLLYQPKFISEDMLVFIQDSLELARVCRASTNLWPNLLHSLPSRDGPDPVTTASSRSAIDIPLQMAVPPAIPLYRFVTAWLSFLEVEHQLQGHTLL